MGILQGGGGVATGDSATCHLLAFQVCFVQRSPSFGTCEPAVFLSDCGLQSRKDYKRVPTWTSARIAPITAWKDDGVFADEAHSAILLSCISCRILFPSRSSREKAPETSASAKVPEIPPEWTGGRDGREDRTILECDLQLLWTVRCRGCGAARCDRPRRSRQGRGPNADSAARTDKRMIDLHGETGRMRQEWAHIQSENTFQAKLGVLAGFLIAFPA